MTQIELQASLEKWQKVLGLSDWEITIALKDAIDMRQHQARTIVQANMQTATIRILNNEDRQPSDPADKDQELDLVHELVHVRLWAIDPKDPDDTLHTCREQAVEWIAKALINTERKKL